MKLTDIFSFDISPFVTKRKYDAGDCIFEEGIELDELIFLEEGRAKCCSLNENGTINLLTFMNAPYLLGSLELLEVQKTANGVIAISHCTCSVINLSACKDQVMNDVKFLRYMCIEVGRMAVNNSSLITLMQSYPLKNRLATYLLQVQFEGVYAGPHTEASAYLGVTYRHLLHVLAQFVDEGILEKRNHLYKIIDMNRLKDLSVTQTHDVE